MLNEHDQEVLLRCRRLGHEINFGYCRQESAGKPCRLILDCWWERFDVRSFLSAHLPEGAMAQFEQARTLEPAPKLASLLDIIQQTKEPTGSQDSKPPSQKW
jgi:hypothetical protein